ncbi:MAG: hypothetical protein ACKO9Z_03045 [Planctomycetota bacterium]
MRLFQSLTGLLILSAAICRGADPAHVKTEPIQPVGLSVSKEDHQAIMADSVPSPECLKGVLIEDEPNTVPITAKERPEHRESSFLDSHAFSFGLGCASSMLALVLMARRQLPPQVINVSMPASPLTHAETRVALSRPAKAKKRKEKKVSYEAATHFDPGPSFEEEKAEREQAEERKAKAMLMGLVDANLDWREKMDCEKAGHAAT